MKEDFDLVPSSSTEYLRSAYLKKQDLSPLGINTAGRISPIRPMFIAYYTDIMTARNNGPENTLLAAEWRAYFPHTIQRGTVTCERCHDNPSRFLIEPEKLFHFGEAFCILNKGDSRRERTCLSADMENIPMYRDYR